MIIFYQGLPGAGKSYEAVVRQIIPALQAGRNVDAYVEGLNHEKIAACAEIPLDRCLQLLTQIDREQVKEIHKHVRPNALVLIDEAQNFWPTNRRPLDEETTRFITEHRHHGLDILLMGQVYKDVHKLWRGRISQLNTYLKLDAVGAEKRYSVLVEKAVQAEKFEKVSSQFGTYDPKYFGTYASHVSDEINTANFQDARANIKNAFWVRWGVPLTIGAAVMGAALLWSFFTSGDRAKADEEAKRAAKPAQVVAPPAPKVLAPPPAPKTFIEALNGKYRLRVAKLYPRSDGSYVGILEWYEGDKLRERLNIEQVQAMGAAVQIVGATLVKVGDSWGTPWPRDDSEERPRSGAQIIPLSDVKPGS
jgi:zona occludens toxin